MEKDPILKIIEESGNGFHLKVAEHLQSLGWEVCVSQFYADPVTDKPREIDILAKKKYPVVGGGESLCVRLFIECKYVNKENVLWFIRKDKEKTKSLIHDSYIMRDYGKYNLGQEPHYLKGDDVAKLTAKTGNTDIFFEGMNGTLHSLIALKNQDYENYRIDYPVIVLNSFDKIYKAVNNDIRYAKIENNFQLAVDYAYLDNQRQVNKYFLIDVSSLDLIESFLKELEEKDIFIAKNLIITEVQKRRYEEMISQRDDNNYDPFSSFGD